MGLELVRHCHCLFVLWRDDWRHALGVGVVTRGLRGLAVVVLSVDQDDALARHGFRHGVELDADHVHPGGLSRGDKGAADVAVFDEAFPVFDAENRGHLQGGGAAGVGNRNHHIDVLFRPVAQDFFRQIFAHAQPGFMH